MLRAMLSEAVAGKELIPLIKYMTQEKVEKFAVATCNSGTAHLDQAYCQDKFPQHKPYAFGFQLLAFMCEIMELNFGAQWPNTGVLDIKFVGAVYGGQSYLVSGVIDAIEATEDSRTAKCSLNIVTHDQETVAVASALVTVPKA